MEAQAQPPRGLATVPPYEEWPSVPKEPLKRASEDGSTSAIDIDEDKNGDEREHRQTSELSMDDIEAAQALEGLRAGWWHGPHISGADIDFVPRYSSITRTRTSGLKARSSTPKPK